MPNPTRRQRERVVGLLRCAADRAVQDRDDGIGGVAHGWNLTPHWWPRGNRVWGLAVLARNVAARDMAPLSPYEDTCLEAAARIEEGWWPNG